MEDVGTRDLTWYSTLAVQNLEAIHECGQRRGDIAGRNVKEGNAGKVYFCNFIMLKEASKVIDDSYSIALDVNQRI